uniref:Uncharacterized protein n=1 Tax=Aegilops tauschii subsp. strangulata TaxID=200361 RepID=A0A453AH81_AEGTS
MHAQSQESGVTRPTVTVQPHHQFNKAAGSQERVKGISISFSPVTTIALAPPKATNHGACVAVPRLLV